MSNYLDNRLAHACQLYLDARDHVGRKADVERAIQEMREVLAKLEPAAPPALGVAVSDAIVMKDKTG